MSDPSSDTTSSRTALRDAEVREASIGQLTSQVTSDVSELFRQEIELAKTEIQQEARQAGKGAGMFGGAGVAAHLALLFASLALMFLLDEAIPIGWAAFVVAVIYVGIAAVLMAVGRQEFRRVSGPSRTVETVKEDAQWLANRKK
jgi:uncharacterized membrane protein YqjE